eukprot:45271_1
MGFCIAIADQKPFLILVPGLFIQFWISLFISRSSDTNKNQGDSQSNPNDTNDKDESASEKKKSCKSKMISFAKETLKIYQICSLIIVFVLDVLHFIDYLNHSSNIGWWNFNCLIEIIVSSSNWKRTLIQTVVMAGTYKRPGNTMIATQRHINENANGGQETQSDHTIQVNKAQTGETNQNIFGVHNIQDDVFITKTIRNEEGILLAVYFVLIRVLTWCTIACVMFTHFIPGLVCYIWVPIVFMIAYAVVTFIVIFWHCGLCHKIKCCDYHMFLRQLCGIGYYKGRMSDEDDDGDKRKKLKVGPLLWSTVFLGFFVCPVLAQCYWYLGDSYIDAFIAVMTERKIDLYFKHLLESPSNVFRCISTVF